MANSTTHPRYRQAALSKQSKDDGGDLFYRGNMSELTPVSKAEQMLSVAETPEETKQVEAVAAAAIAWAKEQNDYELAFDASVVYIKARCKTTELYTPFIEHGGDRGENQYGKWQVNKDVNLPKTVPELTGFTYMQWSRRNKELEAAYKYFDAYQDDCIEKNTLPIVSGLIRFAERLKPKEEPPDLPDGIYRVIYADPPWEYEKHGVTVDERYGSAEFWHYDSMTIKELCDLPVKEIAAEDAVLFIWVTSPKLDQVWDVIKAWGFEYKTSFVWDKIKHNFGYYNSVRHELLLVCGRGSSTPDVKKLYDSVQSIERTDEHSRKPEEFRDIIDTLYTYGNKIELFARGVNKDGWDVWGNESST